MRASVGSPERRRVLGTLAAIAIGGLAGCTSFSGPQTATGQSGRITIVLDNADDTERAYEVEVDWGDNNRSLFSGVLAPGATDSEMVAVTGTAPESADFLIQSTNNTRSGTWSPTECAGYLVNAVIENGTPSFDARCQS